MSTVKRYERLDFVTDGLAKPQTTPEGFWRVEGRIARSGIQEYRRADGKTVRELRAPDDVKSSIGGFTLAPLTNRHPTEMVTPKNAKGLVTGAIGEAKFDGKWVTAAITVYDSDAIDAIKAGRAQLSAGYTCELVEESGEWEGQRYDCKQTGITVNHVALVDIARAGPEARIRLDANDAASGELGTYENSVVVFNPGQEETIAMPHKFKLDGFEIDVADANTQAIIERAVAAARKDEADKAVVSAGEAKVKLDVAEARIKTLEAENAKLDSLSTEKALRMAGLLDNARKHLGANVNLDGGEVALMGEVVKKLLPALKTDGYSEAQMMTAYNAALASAPKEPSAVDKVRGATAPTNGAVNLDSLSPRERMLERNRAAFVK